MTVQRLAPLLSLLILSGCGQAELTPRQRDHQLLATMISKQSGRFHFIPASGAFPPMVLDSATGCLDALSVSDADKSLVRVEVGRPTQMMEHYCKLLGVANVSNEVEK